MKYHIDCSSFDEFMDCIEQLTKRGLSFKADVFELTIDLTGGY